MSNLPLPLHKFPVEIKEREGAIQGAEFHNKVSVS